MPALFVVFSFSFFILSSRSLTLFYAHSFAHCAGFFLYTFEKWQIREVDKVLRLNKISFISFRSEKHAYYMQETAFFSRFVCNEKLLLLIYILKSC